MKNNTMRPHKPWGMRAIYTALILYCTYNVGLFVLLFIGSLKGKTEIFSKSLWSLPDKAMWKNYIDAWDIGKIGQYTMNSVYVTVMTVVITLVLASMAAYILGRVQFKGNDLVLTVIMVGMMLPPFVIAIPLFDILRSLNLLNNLNGLVLVYVAKQLPFTTYMLTSFYKGLPYDLEEAAVIDGASPLTTFAKIMMPLTSSAMLSVSINNMLQTWNEFLLALIFLSDKKIYTLPIGLFYLSQAAEYSSNWTLLFAGMITSVVPILIVFAIFQKQFAQGVSQGAVKG